MASPRHRHFLSALALMAAAQLALPSRGIPEDGSEQEASAEKPAARDVLRLTDALKILRNIPSGRAVLEAAERAWATPPRSNDALQAHFRWGPVSRTDAVLTRHFNPATGKESRTRKVVVILKKGQNLQDVVLDVAHELTHAVAGPTWDPYDPALTASGYIWAALEGEGGEVDALVTECRVGHELSLQSGVSAARCRRYISEGGRVDRERVRRDFYRVGRWKQELERRMGQPALARFTLLSPESPQLYSSTGHAPYPISLLREFEEITEIACENSRKRLSAAAPAGVSRSPASMVRQFIDRRCRSQSSQAGVLEQPLEEAPEHP